jgi:hypothetical protein
MPAARAACHLAKNGYSFSTIGCGRVTRLVDAPLSAERFGRTDFSPSTWKSHGLKAVLRDARVDNPRRHRVSTSGGRRGRRRRIQAIRCQRVRTTEQETVRVDTSTRKKRNEWRRRSHRRSCPHFASPQGARDSRQGGQPRLAVSKGATHAHAHTLTIYAESREIRQSA